MRLPKPPGDLPDPADDPDAAERWPAGFYAVTLQVERHSPGESTARRAALRTRCRWCWRRRCGAGLTRSGAMAINCS
ncbi:MAG: hypothetical protein U0Z44_18380 [Kouleothrix sp.]